MFFNYNAEEFIWITTYIVILFSERTTVDEMNIWGNILSAAGSQLSALAAIYQTYNTSNSSNGNSNEEG
ncbi:MAG: hypothetical protein Q4C00_06490 [Bacillota bacterium]|nr:hypothetical protein [Bacillota bacterium]